MQMEVFKLLFKKKKNKQGTFADVVVHSAMMTLEVTMKKLPVNQKKSSCLISEEYWAVGRTEEGAGFICTCL